MVLKLNNISKRYGKKTVLNQICLELHNGIYGLLGPNGAGKTTLISIITGMLNATEGEILCDGISTKKLKKRYFDYIGYMPQYPGYYNNFTGYEMLDYYAVLKGLKKQERKVKIPEILELVNLKDYSGQKIRVYSGGMKQRVLIAQALLGNPKLLILDEPTAGLDPKQRVITRNLISRLSKDKIVIISTHIVSDIETIADRILLIKQGELIDEGTVPELCEKVKNGEKNLENLYMQYYGDEQ